VLGQAVDEEDDAPGAGCLGGQSGVDHRLTAAGQHDVRRPAGEDRFQTADRLPVGEQLQSVRLG
jgi:hypothetical protein